MKTHLPLIALLIAAAPVAAAVALPAPPVHLYVGEVDVQLHAWGAPDRCEALSRATLYQRVVDGDTALFALQVEPPCGEFAFAFDGERGEDGAWTFRSAGAGMPLVSGYLRAADDGSGLHDFRLGVGPCASGEIICENPPVGGVIVRGQLEALVVVS